MQKIKELLQKYFSKELPIELILFNITTIVGLLGGLVALPINLVIGAPLITNIALLVAIGVDVVCIYAANYKKALRSATISICFMVFIILFPVMFFTGGGPNSGMICWFSIGTIFIFMLLDGMDFFFMLLTDLSIILGCYIVSYYHPEYVIVRFSNLMLYLDMIQSLIITSLGLGTIIRFQLNAYSKLYSLAQVNNDDLLEKALAAKRAERIAQSATEAKSNFLANMSHEIRTPINTIMGMDEMILRETSEKKVEEYALDIKSASDTLLTLINDILDITKIESGKMNIVAGEYEFMNVMRDVLNGVMLRAEEKGLSIVFDVDKNIPCRLIGDDVRIKQILTNILTNAVKYTHQGTITLTVKSSQNLDSTVDLDFSIKDTGIGIKPEDMKHLFESFERIEVSRNRNIEGAGLGMTITRNLLKMMDSNLKVESTYGVGSNFSFVLTQKISDAQPIGDFNQRLNHMNASYEYTSSFEAPDAKFLLVDDNSMNRKVFVSLLKETKVKVVEASSGFECLKLVSEEHFDIIFLDHMMPEIDGVETLMRMKELPSNCCAQTPVIALTANAVAGAKEKYVSLGFDGFLAKPIIPAQLEKVVRNFVPKDLVKYHTETENDKIRKQRQEEVTLPDIEGIDWEYALMHLPNSGMVLQSVNDFYANIGYEKEELKACFDNLREEREYSDYRIKVHGLKSMANTIGATALGALAKLCEHAARDEEYDRIMALHPILMEDIDKMKANLSVLKADVEKPLLEDFDELCALLEMLKVALLKSDVGLADDYMSQINSFSYQQHIQKTIDTLSEHVLNLMVEEALQDIALLQ